MMLGRCGIQAEVAVYGKLAIRSAKGQGPELRDQAARRH